MGAGKRSASASDAGPGRAVPRAPVAGIKRLAELVEKSKVQNDSLTDGEMDELKAAVAVVADPTERMQICRDLGTAFRELAEALNLLIAKDERVQSAHATIEALAKRMRS